MGAVVSAWSSVLAGHEGEILKMLPLKYGPMDRLETIEAGRELMREESVVASKRPSLFDLISLAFLFFVVDPGLYVHMEERMVFVPGRAIQTLKKDAMSSLEKEPGTAAIVRDRKTGHPFLSSGDVVTAWFVTMAASVLDPSSRRSVAIFQPFDIRDRFPHVFPGQSSTSFYVQNAILNYFVIAPVREVVSAEHDSAAFGRFSFIELRFCLSVLLQHSFHSISNRV